MENAKSSVSAESTAPLPCQISLSDVAAVQISSLEEDVRATLLEGICVAYAKSVLKLYEMANATYISLHDHKVLNLFANEKTTFNVEGFQVRVQICDKTLGWDIISIGLPGSLAKYSVMRM